MFNFVELYRIKVYESESIVDHGDDTLNICFEL